MKCGVAEDLEFDHIDPATKLCEVSTLLYTRNLAEFWAEVKKCQLLCVDHHKEKTRQERPIPGHGTQKRYRKPYDCRCAACVARNDEENRKRSERRRTSAQRQLLQLAN